MCFLLDLAYTSKGPAPRLGRSRRRLAENPFQDPEQLRAQEGLAQERLGLSTGEGSDPLPPIWKGRGVLAAIGRKVRFAP